MRGSDISRLENTQSKRQKYLPYIISSTMLPIFILIIGVLDTLFYGLVSAAQLSLSMCFGIFLHISVYYVVLILILPFLRKYFSATACATLWIVPNYHLHSISMEDHSNQKNEKLRDEAAFHKYLSGLTLSELTGYYSFSEYDTKFSCLMNTPEGTQVVQLYDNVISITKLYGETPGRYYYYIEDGTDWEYLRDIVLLFN